MSILLGVDPGSRFTGYGIIEASSARFSVLGYGVIAIKAQNIGDKLSQIFTELSRVIHEFQPESMGIEQVFVAKNPDSALKLGQARGAAICAAVFYQKSVAEYSARQVKQAVVGKGNATKVQVQHMVTRLLNLDQAPETDAADALAVALCHAQLQSTVGKLGVQAQVARGGFRRGRLRVSDLKGWTSYD